MDKHKIFGGDGEPTAMKEALGKFSFCPNLPKSPKQKKQRYIGTFHREDNDDDNELFL